MVKATAEKVAADMSPPNYRGAVKVLSGIEAKKNRIASLNGEIGGIFDRVEGYKVNKKAAKIFMALDKLEAVERNDILRSLEGLVSVAEWDRTDLLTNNDGGGDGTDEDGDDDEVEEIADEVAGEKPEADEIEELADVVEAPAEPEEKPKGNAMLERSRRHLRAVPATGGKPSPEPYTGDNSDLNPDSAAG